MASPTSAYQTQKGNISKVLMIAVLAFASIFLGHLMPCINAFPGSQELDRIIKLPGQPRSPQISQFSGYINVNEAHGRALFYWFFEAQSQPTKKPLLLWLNGGPGCSSIGYGASAELGPLRVTENGVGLDFNKYSWNQEANLLFVESPVGVGFSYTNTSSDLKKLTDKFAAEDAYNFIVHWLDRFPQYKTRDFYISGESYAGHYVPQLAELVFDRNKYGSKYPHINLKGFIVGNPETDDYLDNKGLLEYAWSHAVISDQEYEKAKRVCNFKHFDWTNDCMEAMSVVFKIYNEIDIYNIYAPACLVKSNYSSSLTQANQSYRMRNTRSLLGGYDPCYSNCAEDYFNRVDVQTAFHANTRGSKSTVKWATCSNSVFKEYNDTVPSVLPIYKKLIKGGLRIWIYSGDADGRVPVIGSRYCVESLNLTLKSPWHSWYHNHQVGGRLVEYDGLTFVTVRGAGHLQALTGQKLPETQQTTKLPFDSERASPHSDRSMSGTRWRVKSTSCGMLMEGMTVEVSGQKEEDSKESWYRATIVKSLGERNFLVEYQTLRTEDKSRFLMEEVDVLYIRPCPPVIERVECFECSAQVDAWYNDGWYVGHISEVIGDDKYIFCFKNTSEGMMFERSNLRLHQDWAMGTWFAASNRGSTSRETRTKELKVRIKCGGKTSDLEKGSMVERSSGQVATTNAKRLKVGITAHRTTSEQLFIKGMMVEVKSDEQGYLGSWYTAQVVGQTDDRKYLVEYQTLKTEDESELLVEPAESYFIRPCPPQITKADGYKMLEEVDVWFNDGWWVGVISRNLGARGFAVYFWTTNEELEFSHRDLRPHQEWIGGKWTTVFRKKPELSMNSKLGRVIGPKDESALGECFLNESRVEVTSDEEGYKDCWYPAKVLRSVKYRKYLVEYATLTTDDETELLKQEVDALCIRPSPRWISGSERFKLFQKVGAWYNEGWWVGLVCEVAMNGTYMVYLTNIKVLEFQHSDLRPHLNWLNQQWISVAS
ncbi:OLC1v1020545C1 [Oldenlandia corymbosa var. corymbosa]|uniref:OLC1v1020545C1 n=1 Tax=Oldenlandia corymbosa var. corymbosa TaxID=529605 RepID=A0AAV1EGS9_OLDCO|nr:OLC1v1020545C1 [Oldenlandia corymbosa var. corymbosa]